MRIGLIKLSATKKLLLAEGRSFFLSKNNNFDKSVYFPKNLYFLFTYWPNAYIELWQLFRDKSRKKLLPQAKFCRRLLNKKISIKEKKRILIKKGIQKGGFLQFIIPTIISAIGGIISSVITSKAKETQEWNWRKSGWWSLLRKKN